MLIGVDAGPRQTLASLRLGNAAQIELSSGYSQRPESLAQLIQDRRVDGVVLGSSTSEDGIKAEQACLRAACDLHLPTIVIEDMPGNYRPVEGLIPDLVVVESPLVVNHVLKRSRVLDPASVISGASVRYDYLRLQAQKGKRLEIKNISRCLVWLGQPETQANLYSLEQLLPHVSRMGFELLFKAHPRDAGYPNGQYVSLFSDFNDKVVDVSAFDSAALLACQPSLVLTHFSSMAIEFAFMGVPCCNVLFAQSGGAIYKDMTGLQRPFLCEIGGSGTISNVDSIKNQLEQLLFDESARKAQMASFDEYFDVGTLQRPGVVKAIERVVLDKQKNR